MTEPPSFSIEMRRDGAETTAVVAGELDMTTAPQLRDACAGHLSDGLRLDLAAVTFMDSSGVAALDALLREAQREGGRLVVASQMHDTIVRLLQMTGMMDVLPIEGGEADR